MNNIVNFETAKLLKEHGYDEYCQNCYDNFGNEFDYVNYRNTINLNITHFAAPTIIDAIEWIYLKFNFWICVSPAGDEKDYPRFIYSVFDLKDCMSEVKHQLKLIKKSYEEIMNDSFKTPTEAYEAGIKYVLKKLI